MKTAFAWPEQTQQPFLASLTHIIDTKAKDGYFGDLTDVSLGFDPESSRIICVHKHGYFSVGTESDAESADWRIMNSPEYRTFACNLHFRPD